MFQGFKNNFILAVTTTPILIGLETEYYGMYNIQHYKEHREVFGVIFSVWYATTLNTEEKTQIQYKPLGIIYW